MSYGYYPNLLKDYENIILWINHKTIKYRVKVFEKKCASVPTDYPITAFVQTENNVTASVLYENPVTASVATEIYVTASVPTDYPITTYVPTANHVTAYVPSDEERHCRGKRYAVRLWPMRYFLPDFY